MMVSVTKLYKQVGHKELFSDLNLIVNEGEKIAIVGRNGLGKTTLFRILTGEDPEFDGQIELRKDAKVVMTRQEHVFPSHISALEYILDEVPSFRELQRIIQKGLRKDSSMQEIEEYTECVNRFAHHDYYHIEENILVALEDFQIDMDKALAPLSRLSGGEKRFVELVRLMYSGADLVLIDEPTNHMDYVGKERFIRWLKDSKQTVLVITHDRDVLQEVERIVEIKDKQATSYSGNYEAYLAQNSLKTVTGVTQYELDLKNLEILHKKMLAARDHKEKSKSDGARTSARKLEEKYQRQYDQLKEALQKPSFWIDQESLAAFSETVVDKYEKYKERNIVIKEKQAGISPRRLLQIRSLSIGYSSRLFNDLNFEMYHYDKVHIRGRNGAGKSTLVKTIIASATGAESQTTIFHGEIRAADKLRIGIYEQEISPEYLGLTLGAGVENIYKSLNMPINDQKVRNVLGRYLFDPIEDARIHIGNLSGGQKARFQLIKMLANNPNLLILDEPTNHLDLPSIEELEKALMEFEGAIIYVTHDRLFQGKLGGKIIDISN